MNDESTCGQCGTLLGTLGIHPKYDIACRTCGWLPPWWDDDVDAGGGTDADSVPERDDSRAAGADHPGPPHRARWPDPRH